MNREEIRETMLKVNEYMIQKCKLAGEHSKEIYLLALALKELNQLEPK